MTKQEVGTEVFGDAFRSKKNSNVFPIESLRATGAILRGDTDAEAKRVIRWCFERLADEILFAAEDGEQVSEEKRVAFCKCVEEMEKRGQDIWPSIDYFSARSSVDVRSVLGL